MKEDFEERTPGITPEKKKYIPPRMEIIWVELEQGIANGSTFISTNQGDVKTEWEGVDDEQETEVIF
ncbi:hypothetical protein CMU93_05755 [Elizabethkingia anophelis]|nr:hypothetical protein [Elizabethkingia anophelis]